MNKKRTSIEGNTSIKDRVKDIQVHISEFEEDLELKQRVSIIIDLKSGESVGYNGRMSNPHVKEILGKVFSFYSNMIGVYLHKYEKHPGTFRY